MPDHPHCAAIASAIPGSVRERSFQRSGPGLAWWTRGIRPSTILVGWRWGSPLSHKQVALVSPCPNCQGWMIWSGFLICVLIMPTGFSKAMRGIPTTSSRHLTKRMAVACSKSFPLNQRAPETARCVQGGCEMSKSHGPNKAAQIRASI